MLVVPFFQPIVDTQTSRIVGHEVLARELHNDGSITSASKRFNPHYFDIAEIIQLDRHIRAQALEAFAKQKQPGFITLNISPEWLSNSSTILPTIQLIEEYGIMPDKIVIEITEHAGEIDHLLSAIASYREKGLKIAVDDFGSGHSSFERVAQIKPDLIKIDMALFKAAVNGGMAATIVDTVRYFANKIDSLLLVEGVENFKEYLYGLSIQCELMQGFIFDPALAQLQSGKKYHIEN